MDKCSNKDHRTPFSSSVGTSHHRPHFDRLTAKKENAAAYGVWRHNSSTEEVYY